VSATATDVAAPTTRGQLPRGALARRTGPFGTALCALLLLLGVLLPSYGNDYYIGLVILVCVYGTVTVSWNLVLGFGGLFTFGQMAFFAIGAYTAALLSTKSGVSPWLGLAAGTSLAGCAGLLIGLPSLRLYGPYMVLFTLAFQLTLQIMITTDTSGFTGGADGVIGLPALTFPGLSTADTQLYFALAMISGTLISIGWLLRSPVGGAIQALRDSEDVAVARGVGRTRHRVTIFVVSAAFTGLAGSFYAYHSTVITPSVLDLGLLVQLLAMIIIGGTSSMGGVLAGTALIVWLDDRLATEGSLSKLLYGAIILAVVVLLPGGISGTVQRVRRYFARRLDTLFQEDERTEASGQEDGPDAAHVPAEPSG
jgi:branched-chain amino acid transport system permease protein